MAPRNARRVLRAAGALLIVSAIGLPSLTMRAADAQVPPLPPFPQEVNDLIQVASPVAHPLCGNVLFANTIAIGTLPPELKEPMELVTANAYTACAMVPAPANEASRCLDQDVTETVLAQVSGSAIGGALPIAPPGGGQVVDAIEILLERYGGGDPGVVPALAAALACRAASVDPAPRAPAPGAAAPSDVGSPDSGVAGAAGGVDAANGLDEVEPVAIGGDVAPPSATDAAALPAQVAGATSPPAARSIGVAMLLAAVGLVAAALVIGRGLLFDEPRSSDGPR